MKLLPHYAPNALLDSIKLQKACVNYYAAQDILYLIMNVWHVPSLAYNATTILIVKFVIKVGY